MFTHRSLHTRGNSRNVVFKYLTMFFLGASCVVLLTQGFNITTSLANTVQYIGKIILTDNGSSQNAITGIVLDGSNGSAFFSGNVGIGTGVSNSYALTVDGDIKGQNGYLGKLSLGNFGIKMNDILDDNGNNLSIVGSSTSPLSLLYQDDFNGGNIYIVPGNGLNQGENGNIFLGLSGSSAIGKIGIGTGVSNALLTVGGDFIIQGSGSIDGNLSIKNNLSITGNVGIGTSASNAYALNISGETQSNNSIHANYGLYLSGTDTAYANINTLGAGGALSELNLGNIEDGAFTINSIGNFSFSNQLIMHIDHNGLYLPEENKVISTDAGKNLSIFSRDYPVVRDTQEDGLGGGNINIKGGHGENTTSMIGGNGGNIFMYGGIGGHGGSPYYTGDDGNIFIAWDGASAIGRVGIGTNVLTSALTVSGDIETAIGGKMKTDILQLKNNGNPPPCNSGNVGQIVYSESSECLPGDDGCLFYCAKTAAGYDRRMIAHTSY